MMLKKSGKVALITGGARRIGAAMVRYLHAQGMNVVIHYHTATDAAQQLVTELNQSRPNSAFTIKADLSNSQQLAALIPQAIQAWQRLDVIINNASNFYPTPIANATESAWDDLLAVNLKAPFFLAKAAAQELAKQQGCIINITATHAERPLKDYPIYNIAKAGLAMLTKTLARELAPEIRVNAIAPGSILWPENMNESELNAKQKILDRIPLKRQGEPDDIAKAVWFLINDANYVTGSTIAIDGGRLLFG